MPLTLWGNPVLDALAAPLIAADFGPALAALAERMLRVMYAAEGAGLAAPQVDISKRFFVYDCQGQRGLLANPEIVFRSRELLDEEEGCLSVPGFRWPTPRAAAVVVRGQDAFGEPLQVEAHGYLARCLQHEIDHLDGRLYLSRLGGRLHKRARSEATAAHWYGQPSRFVAVD